MTKATKNNVIATIVSTAQGATVKTVSAPSSFTNDEVLGFIDTVSNNLIALKGAEDTVAHSTEELTKLAKQMHEGGFRCVDLRGSDKNSAQGKQTQLFKSGLIDSLKAGGLTASYSQKLYEDFSKSVNSGKPFKKNTARAEGKKAGQKKGSQGKKTANALDKALALYDTNCEKYFSQEFIDELTEVLVANNKLELTE